MYKTDSYVLCVPTNRTLRCDSPNNTWMAELSAKERQVDYYVAQQQFHALYQFLCTIGFVYLLPPGDLNTQDQVYVANAAAVLPHTENRVAIASNFTAQERKGEEVAISNLLSNLGLEVHHSPYKFEGEAELKHLYGSVYACSHGMRTEIDFHNWLKDKFGLEVVSLKLTSDRLYHLDCAIFPVSPNLTFVCGEIFSARELRELERHTEIIDVPLELAEAGVNNCMRAGEFILCSSDIHSLSRYDPEFQLERRKNRFLEDACTGLGLELVTFDLSEFYKSGALLSCLVLHLSRYAYAVSRPSHF